MRVPVIAMYIPPRTSAAVLLLLLSVGAGAQPIAIDTLRAVQPWGLRVEYTFPHVRLAGNEMVAARINRDLLIAFLGVDPDTLKGDPLQEIWGEEEHSGMPRINSLNWRCDRSAPEVLTVHLSGEYCGAHCEGFDLHFLYHLRSGQRLDLENLFAAEHLDAVHAEVGKRWRFVLTGHIGDLENARKALHPSPERKAWLDEAIDMYRSCLESAPDDRAPVIDLFHAKDRLRFFTGRCSAHVDQEMDDLFPLAIDLMRDEVLDLLQPEARQALGW